ncbi:hypothetical protein PENSPDRAFT_734437 [Peniophora sp. CONT]|nr:hypothetical protein PENSPDRAFT_734437 [Peniophora sp. CONT]
MPAASPSPAETAHKPIRHERARARLVPGARVRRSAAGGSDGLQGLQPARRHCQFAHSGQMRSGLPGRGLRYHDCTMYNLARIIAARVEMLQRIVRLARLVPLPESPHPNALIAHVRPTLVLQPAHNEQRDELRLARCLHDLAVSLTVPAFAVVREFQEPEVRTEDSELKGDRTPIIALYPHPTLPINPAYLFRRVRRSGRRNGAGEYRLGASTKDASESELGLRAGWDVMSGAHSGALDEFRHPSVSDVARAACLDNARKHGIISGRTRALPRVAQDHAV